MMIDSSCLTFELWQIIASYVDRDFKSQLSFNHISAFHRHYFPVTILERESSGILAYNLTDYKLRRFPFLKVLDINTVEINDISFLTDLESVSLYISNVKDVSMLTKLHTLKASSAIDNESIRNLENLKILKIYDSVITDINHLTALEELTVHGDIFTDEGFSELRNIKKLHLCDCVNVQNLSHLTLLEELVVHDVEKYTPISNISIVNLKNLRCLILNDHYDVTHINHLTLLEELYISMEPWNVENAPPPDADGLHQDGIPRLPYLTKMTLHDNPHVYNINHLTSLTFLDISGFNSRLSHEGIKELKALKELRCDYNSNVKNISFFTELVTFSQCMETMELEPAVTGITQDGIKGLKKLESITLDGNQTFLDLNHLTSLKYISATHDCGIEPESICSLPNLETLHTRCNENFDNN